MEYESRNSFFVHQSSNCLVGPLLNSAPMPSPDWLPAKDTLTRTRI